jgi:hypothetical protein
MKSRVNVNRAAPPPWWSTSRRNGWPSSSVWGYWKHHELPNLCPKTFGALSHHARAALRRMRRRPTLVAAFWQQAELFG